MLSIDEIEGLPEAGPRSKEGDAAVSTASNEALEDSIRAGDELHDAVRSLAMRGYTRERLEQLLNESAAKTDRPDRWREVVESDLPRAIKSATAKREKEAERIFASIGVPPLPVVTGLPLIKPGDFASRKLRKRKWIAEPLIPRGETTLVYGPGSAGKSLLLFQLCLAMACGRRWLGMQVPKGRCLMFTCEDDTDELNRRGDAILKSMGLTWADVGDRFLAIPMRGTDASAVLAVKGRDETLQPTPTYTALKSAIAEFKPDVTVLDTLADVFAGNENDRGHAKQFIKMVERLYPCSYIVTAHPSVSGQADGRGASGSTGWPAAVRSHLYLERLKSDDEGAAVDPDLRQLSNLKANYARAGDGGFELRWVAGVFERSDRPAREAGGEDVDALFLDMLARYTSDRRYVGHKPGISYAPTLFAKEAGMGKRAMTDAMNRLFKAKRIRVVDHRIGGRDGTHLEVCESPSN